MLQPAQLHVAFDATECIHRSFSVVTYDPLVLQTVKKGNIGQLQFKGDPMHRPVMSREVGFLVRCLVALSEGLNRQLGLDQPAQEGEMAETQIQVWWLSSCTHHHHA